MKGRQYTRAVAGGGVFGRVATVLTGCALLLAASAAELRAPVSGVVVHVADASRFTVGADDGRRLTVRLAGALPPPAGRAAAAARRALAGMLFGERVVLVQVGDNGDVPAALAYRGGADVALEMVADGWLRADGSRAELLEVEARARARGLGQWRRETP